MSMGCFCIDESVSSSITCMDSGKRQVTEVHMILG